PCYSNRLWVKALPTLNSGIQRQRCLRTNADDALANVSRVHLPNYDSNPNRRKPRYRRSFHRRNRARRGFGGAGESLSSVELILPTRRAPQRRVPVPEDG